MGKERKRCLERNRRRGEEKEKGDREGDDNANTLNDRGCGKEREEQQLVR